MAVNLFTLSLFTHILFVAAWLFTIPIAALIERAANATSNQAEKYKILSYISVNSIIGLVSAVVIFITGAIMTTELDMWAPSGRFWLVTKQSIWVLIIILYLVLLAPTGKKFGQQLQESAPEEEVMATFKNLKIRGHILTAFILINIFLATTQPF